MSKGKTGLIVLTLFAAAFFLFIAILFDSSTKRQDALDRKAELESRLTELSQLDLRIYWIGEPPSQLATLEPVISVVTPESASEDTLPVKGPSFHTTEYTPDGQVVSEDIPKEYPEKMLIVITGNPNLPEKGREALLDAVSKNGVPVLAIGDEASEFLSGVISYRRLHKGEGSSLYYCLGHGYKENPIKPDLVKAGGIDLAEAIPDRIILAMQDYKSQN